MRDRSRMSEMTWACARRVALDGVEAAAGGGLVEPAPAQQVGPAHDGGERRAQLVGQRGEELVLDPARRLRLRAGVLRLGEQPLALALVAACARVMSRAKALKLKSPSVRDGGDGELEREGAARRARRASTSRRGSASPGAGARPAEVACEAARASGSGRISSTRACRSPARARSPNVSSARGFQKRDDARRRRARSRRPACCRGWSGRGRRWSGGARATRPEGVTPLR